MKARPLGGEGGRQGKKGSDRGIDGIITLIDDASGKPKRAMIQVKSGKVKSGDVRDLIGVVEGEKAVMGIFITLEKPTADMQTAAVTAGFYHSPGWERDYPRIQILTISDLLSGAEVKMPRTATTFRQADKIDTSSQKQQSLFGEKVAL